MSLKNLPLNTKLYEKVRQMANNKFKSNRGIYRSSWMVKKYKNLGGKYSGKKSSKSGLARWFKEDWIDLNRPIKNSNGKIIGYKKCGRKSSNKGKYPLCRPSKRINSKTPLTYKELDKKSILKAKKEKSKIKNKKNITSFKKPSKKKSKKKSVKKSKKKSKKKNKKKKKKKNKKKNKKK